LMAAATGSQQKNRQATEQGRDFSSS